MLTKGTPQPGCGEGNNCSFLEAGAQSLVDVCWSIIAVCMTCEPHNCVACTAGVAEVTFGLFNAPCKACTKNTYSPMGSTSYHECVNPVGFGYTSEGANQCPPDFYAAAEVMLPCTQCPPGRFTEYEPGNGTLQASVTDCKIPSGWGVFTANAEEPYNPTDVSSNMTANRCPTGWYSAGDAPPGAPTVDPRCQRCPAAQSTSADEASKCDGELQYRQQLILCKPDSHYFGRTAQYGTGEIPCIPTGQSVTIQFITYST